MAGWGQLLAAGPSELAAWEECAAAVKGFGQGAWGTASQPKERMRGCGHSEEACCGKRGQQGRAMTGVSTLLVLVRDLLGTRPLSRR